MSKLIKAKDGVEWYADGKILLIRCPQCKRENYALAVADGVCCWCGYKPNPIPQQKKDQSNHGQEE